MSAPVLFFALVHKHAGGRNKVVRDIQAYVAEIDGCLVSEDGIRRILQARDAIAAAYKGSGAVGDAQAVELQDGSKAVSMCQGCSVTFRKIKRMI